MTTEHASDPEELLRIGDAARVAGVSVDTLRRWTAKGHVPHIRRPSGDRVFRRADVEALTRTAGTTDQPAAAAG